MSFNERYISFLLTTKENTKSYPLTKIKINTEKNNGDEVGYSNKCFFISIAMFIHKIYRFELDDCV